MTDDIVGALKTVYDPEIPADIYELGLIYKIDIADDRAVTVDMTLTTPNCPSAQELPIMVENAVASVAGVGPVKVNIVWDPPWDPSRMSDEARAASTCGELRQPKRSHVGRFVEELKKSEGATMAAGPDPR